MKHTNLKAIGLAMVVAVFGAQAVMAFPAWIGVYNQYQRHNAGNPGKFTILMNQDSFGLQAEVGIQVNNGPWNTFPMTYAGNVDGNSKWEFTPSTPFSNGAHLRFATTPAKQYSVRYCDDLGAHVWQDLPNSAFSGDGADKQTDDATAANVPQRFYRVRMQ